MMKRYKYLIVAVLMSVLNMQAQAQNQPLGYSDARTNTWSVYIGGGVSGYHGLRGTPETGINSTFMAPDFSLGVKFNITPCVRVGFNAGYTKTKAQNSALDTLTTTTPGYQVGDYKDGTLIVRSAVLDNRYDQHQAFGDINVDINPISAFTGKAYTFNLWLGTGVGYLHGRNKHTVSTAYDEEAVSQGADHFNVYNHSYITTTSDNVSVDVLYIPFRLSVEYDVTPRWTLGLKGEYRMLPMNTAYTPKGLWGAGATVAYNFTKMPTAARQKELALYNTVLSDLNAKVNSKRSENTKLTAKSKVLQDSLNSVTKRLIDISKTTPPVSIVYFKAKSSKVANAKIDNMDMIKKMMTEYPYYTVRVRGYASDDEGDDSSNKRLSQKRAQTVANILVNKLQIPLDHIKAEGCGTAGNELYTAAVLHRCVLVYFLENPVVK